MQNATLGAAIVILGGLLHGSFALPMKRLTRWKWENIWLVYSVVGLIIFPVLLAMATVPSLGEVYARSPGSVIVLVAIFGFGWGLGSTLFGLGISRVGMALGFSIILGITSSVGSLLPLLILNPEQLWTRKGACLSLGLAIAISGIIASARAGALREAELRTGTSTTAHTGFKTGLLICIASGVLSPMLNFGFVFGKPLQDAAVVLGARADLASNSIWAPALGAGFLANAGYAVYLLGRNHTWHVYRDAKATAGYWIGASVMGLLWFGGVSIYGMGAATMGPLGGVAGWPIFMSMVIVTANCLGALTGEWAGVSLRTRRISWFGIAILVAAIAVISLGN
jgi:L-rhamnose-H+ transport protein